MWTAAEVEGKEEMGNYSIPHLYRDVNYLLFAAVCVVGKEKIAAGAAEVVGSIWTQKNSPRKVS